MRKFSIPYTSTSAESKPQELTWLLNQVGQLTSKLTDLLQEMNAKLETLMPHISGGEHGRSEDRPYADAGQCLDNASKSPIKELGTVNPHQ